VPSTETLPLATPWAAAMKSDQVLMGSVMAVLS